MKLRYEVTAKNHSTVHMLLARTGGIKANELRRMDREQLAATLRFAVLDGRVTAEAAALAVEGLSPPTLNQWRPPEVVTEEPAPSPLGAAIAAYLDPEPTVKLPPLEETAASQKAALDKLD